MAVIVVSSWNILMRCWTLHFDFCKFNPYGKTTISGKLCQEWFQRFKIDEFCVEYRHSDRQKVVEDIELEAIGNVVYLNQEELSE